MRLKQCGFGVNGDLGGTIAGQFLRQLVTDEYGSRLVAFCVAGFEDDLTLLTVDENR